MADISVISRLINGYQRNIDISQNSLVVGSIKIGTSSPVEITKAIATKLLAIQTAADADGTYDTRYTKKVDLASTANGKGASLVGIEDAGGYYSGSDVESALQQLGAAVGSGAAEDISYDNTSSGLAATNVQDAIDEVEDRVDDVEVLAAGAIQSTEKGANNGVATLDGGGKIPVGQLPNAVMTYEGMWAASTNTPTLADGVGNAGMVYRVSDAGSVDFGSGSISFAAGDYVIYSGTVWEKSDGTDAVNSVNGQQGIVVLDTDDISEGSNLYFTDERAQDAVGAMIADTATIDLTYTDATPELKADVKTNSLDSSHLKTGTVDQSTLLGGNGTPFSVHHSALVQKSMVAGESLADDETFALRLAVDGETSGRVYKADKDASTDLLFHVVGLARKVGGASAGDSIQMVMMGSYSLGANDTPFAGTDIGKAVFLDAAGALTLTPPSSADEAVFKVGIVESTTSIFVGNMQLNGIN